MIKVQDGEIITEASCDLCGKEWNAKTDIFTPDAWAWSFFAESDDIGYTALCPECSEKEQDPDQLLAEQAEQEEL